MKKQLNQETGQSAVIIALMLVGIFAMLGLIFDVSNAYAQRRYMQNAADAASLAGARVLALRTDNSAATEQAILSAINAYGANNGTPTTLTGVFLDSNGNQTGVQIGVNGGVPGSATGVRVTAKKAFDTFLLRAVGAIMGMDSVTSGEVGAVAAAQTGAAGAPTAGLMPIAVPRCFVDNSYSHNSALCGSGNQTGTSHVIIGQDAQDPSGGSSFRGIINFRDRTTDDDGDHDATGNCGDGNKQDAVRYIEAGGYNGECGPVDYNQWVDVLTGNSNGNAGVDAYNPNANGHATYTLNGTTYPMYPIGTIILVCVYPEGTIGNGTNERAECIGFAAIKITAYGSNWMKAVYAGKFLQSGPIVNTAPDSGFQRRAVQLIQ